MRRSRLASAHSPVHLRACTGSVSSFLGGRKTRTTDDDDDDDDNESRVRIPRDLCGRRKNARRRGNVKEEKKERKRTKFTAASRDRRNDGWLRQQDRVDVEPGRAQRVPGLQAQVHRGVRLRLGVRLHRADAAHAEKVRPPPSLHLRSLCSSTAGPTTTVAQELSLFFYLPPCVSIRRRKLLTTAQYIYKTLFQEEKGSDITVFILGRAWRLHKVYISQV